MRVITISREFGSGGRELGKRIADILGIAYYDREIISAIAEESKLDTAYVDKIIEKGGVRNYPITIGRTLVYPAYLQQDATNILVARQKIMKAAAEKGDCVVTGQNADIILREHCPFNMFVYADTASKIQRCRERTPAGESLSDKELIKKMKQIDAARIKGRQILSSLKWGSKENYHLCVNTTNTEIKTLAPRIAAYAEYWLGLDGK